LASPDGKKLTLAGSSGIRPGSLDSFSNGPWPLAQVARSRVPEKVSDLRARLGEDLPRTPWEEGPDSAIVFPLSRSRSEDPAGFLVLGISPRLEFADAYLEFFNLVSYQIATHIANARLRLEAEEERARLDRVIQNTPVVFWAVDQNGVFTLSLGKALEDLGLRPNEIVGKCHFDLYKDYPEAVALVKRALQGESFSAATVIQGRALETNYTPIRDSRGEVSGVVAISTDVTARMLAQKEAEVERERLQRLFMEAPVGICVFDGPEHTFTLANPTFYAVLFGENRDFIGKTVREAVPEVAGQGFFELLDGVYQSGESVIGTETPIHLKQADGTEKQFFVNFIYQAKRNAEGRIDGILAVVYDVTELVVARHRTEQALQSRDEFLSIASHELKTPLTSLHLEAQIARRRLAKDESKAVEMPWIGKLVNQTDKSILRLTRLVDDMLDVSRIATGKLSLQMETFDLCELAQEIADRMQAQVQAAGTTLTLMCCEPVSGNWDRFRIEQVITNLLTNAIRYGHGSPIELSVSRNRDQAVLSVRDHGPGILPENMERIFQRFERGAAGSGISGLGLGLFICREIIERHGGHIFVESEQGKGATFKVLLPLGES
ncbi:MAG: ATP-binding protein, partial [Bdellovibrionia bacterium]